MYNILVVDDERIHREGIIMLLEKICPDDMLWEASNGQEAMEIMNNISCEIVISDIRMAEMDGLQPKSRDIQAKIPLPQAIWNEFWLRYCERSGQ